MRENLLRIKFSLIQVRIFSANALLYTIYTIYTCILNQGQKLKNCVNSFYFIDKPVVLKHIGIFFLIKGVIIHHIKVYFNETTLKKKIIIII